MAGKTMKAVVFKGPRKVAIEDRPVPQIKDDTDIIVEVTYSALCGRYYLSRLLSMDNVGVLADCVSSELHVFRVSIRSYKKKSWARVLKML